MDLEGPLSANRNGHHPKVGPVWTLLRFVWDHFVYKSFINEQIVAETKQRPDQRAAATI